MKVKLLGVVVSLIGAWLIYLVFSFALLELFVAHRNIEIVMEIESDSEQEVIMSYNISPFQAGAVPYSRTLKRGSNKVIVPFVNDLEIRRLYVSAASPIRLFINSFSLANTVNDVEIPINLLAENSTLFSNGGQDKIDLALIEQKLPVQFTKTHSKLVISKPVMDDIYDELINRYYQIAKVIAVIGFFFLLFIVTTRYQIKGRQVFAFSFLVIIFTPFFSQKDNHTSENRELAPFPDLNVNIWKIPRNFDKYYNDHFPFRNALRSIGNHIKYDLFNTSPKPDIVQINKDGWLFFTSKEIRSVYQGTHLYSQAQLEQIKENLETRARLLAKEGITYYFVLAPLKHPIYPEFLPKGFEIVGPTTKREQVVNYLKANSSVNLIDPYQTLVDLKSSYRVYYKSDTHWNRMGAFHVYQLIINRIRKDFPSISPTLKLDDFDVSRKVDYTGDLVSLLDMENTFSREPYYLLPKYKSNYTSEFAGGKMGDEIGFLYYETDQKDKPRMLLYRDSFGEYLRPYLAEHFSYSGVVWARQLNKERILHEKPDILIQETMERFIDDLLVN